MSRPQRRSGARTPVWALACAGILLAGCDVRGAEMRAGATASAPAPAAARAPAVPFDEHLLVDQFGYRPTDDKVLVVRDPQAGFDRERHFVPGERYEVRRVADDAVVLAGAPTPWNNGRVQASSGDRGWWFDFSSLDEPGDYYVADVQRNVRSATFRVARDVYRPLLKAAVRTYYYQRSGLAKRRPHAEACWEDDAAYLGPRQDGEARDITDPDNGARIRDLSGGWFDAGDTNKYVTFAAPAVHQLLGAYEQSPRAFGDDFNLPESGNGIPDLLDEVRWELAWLRRMQSAEGGVALKVGDIRYVRVAPPGADRSARYYVPTCTSSTIAAAGMFAHAATVFARLPALAGEAADLRRRAGLAWRHYLMQPRLQTDCDTGVVHSGDADWDEARQRGAAVTAAVYLFAATHAAEYDAYVHAHYRETRAYRDAGWSRYQPDEGESLLSYAMSPEAERALRTTILDDKRADVRAHARIYGFNRDDDLYRSYLDDAQYHWGSNSLRAAYGNTALDALPPVGGPQDVQERRTRALGALHYLHGVNPLAMVYLSNMAGAGATRSASRIFHAWFAPGTRWADAQASACGPAPGFLVGGPDAQAAGDGVPARRAPPTGQPPQKSYLDWNDPDEHAWVVNEPAIYYQASYVKLLSHFVE